MTRGTAITVPIEGAPMSELISPETLRHVIDISQPPLEGIDETSCDRSRRTYPSTLVVWV